MSFDIECARRRLNATVAARELVREATHVLADADVQSTKVAEVLVAALSELSTYKHTTQYAIRKREARAKEHRRG